MCGLSGCLAVPNSEANPPIVFFVDPDGHYWEVAYGPDWKFDEQNMLVID